MTNEQWAWLVSAVLVLMVILGMAFFPISTRNLIKDSWKDTLKIKEDVFEDRSITGVGLGLRSEKEIVDHVRSDIILRRDTLNNLMGDSIVFDIYHDSDNSYHTYKAWLIDIKRSGDVLINLQILEGTNWRWLDCKTPLGGNRFLISLIGNVGYGFWNNCAEDKKLEARIFRGTGDDFLGSGGLYIKSYDENTNTEVAPVYDNDVVHNPVVKLQFRHN